MGYPAVRNGVEGYVDDNGTFWPNRGEVPGYNDALAQANSLRSHEKSMQNLDGLTDHQAALANAYDGIKFRQDIRRATGGLFGPPGDLDKSLGVIDAAQEAYKGKVYNQRRNVDQWRARQGLQPLYKWEGGLNPPVSETKVQPGSSIGPNAIQTTPGELARKSEADRMMQQYASDEYWDTEAGKAMMELGSQESYEGDNLAEFYNAQQAVGTGTIDEIIDGMGYTGNMETWARANPALALREYQKNSEALPTDGSAGYGTGELQVDERLKDILNYSGAYTPPTQTETTQQSTADKFLQERVGQYAGEAPWVNLSEEPFSGISAEGLIENTSNPWQSELNAEDFPVLNEEQLKNWQRIVNGRRGPL